MEATIENANSRLRSGEITDFQEAMHAVIDACYDELSLVADSKHEEALEQHIASIESIKQTAVKALDDYSKYRGPDENWLPSLIEKWQQSENETLRRIAEV